MRKQLTVMQLELKAEESLDSRFPRSKQVVFKPEPPSESETDSEDDNQKGGKANKVHEFDAGYRNSAYWKLPEQCRDAIDKAQEKY